MRNQQESGGNRYQFRLHPAPPPSPPPLSPTSSTTTSSSSSSSSSMSATSSAASSPTLLGATTIMTSQQQKLQKPLMTKIDEVQNITNNNNNNSNNINKITNNSSNNNNNNVNKCGSEKNKVKVVKDVAGTTSTAIHLQRKQFTPTSDASNSSFSSASVAGSIQDDMSDQCSLTQAGLEEYNIRASSYYDQPALYHHQKQSSYAQSEGYHSYVSSSDSSSATPFLDRLRQESELLSRQSLNWSQNDLSSVSCNSVAPSPTPLMLNTNTMDQRQELLLQQQSPSQKNHNSSESTSSTETLKWLGSMSDVSEASHATGYSTISESVSTSQLIVHSSRVLTPKRHHSESVLYLNDNNTNNELLQQQQQQPSPATQETGKNLNSLPQMSTASSENGIVDNSNDLEGSPMLRFTPNHRHSPSYPPIHTTPQQTIYSYQQKPLLTAMSARFLRRDSNDFLNKSPSEGTKNSSHALSTTPPSAATPCKPSTDKTNNMPPSPPLKRNAENTSPASSPGSGSDTNCYRSNHRLFPVSTYTEPVHSNTSHYVLHPKPQYSAGLKKNLLKGQQQTSDKKTLPMKSLSPPNNAANTNKNSTNSTLSPPYPSWQSVAALINDFERSKNSQEQQQQQQQQQQKQTIIQGQSQKYTYMDPSKTHRVSNPALKAFQKNAVQSYFERQQQQKHSKDPQQHKIYNQLQQEQRPHSYQAAASPKEVTSEQLLRNSLPNTTTTPITTMPAVNRRNSPPEIEFTLNKKSPSPTPPPPPPRSRSLMPNLLRRSSSASDYAEFKEQYTTQNNTDSPLATVRNVSSAEKISFNDCGMPPPPPPPRGRPSFTTTRRTSSASEYAAMRDKALLQQAAAAFAQAKQNAQHAPHPYYTTPAVTANGKEGWVPERPPKNPNLRIPSPDLPPPPANTDVEVTGVSDEPLPPPPPEVYNRTVANNVSPTQSSSYTKLSQSSEVLSKPPQANRRNSFAGSSERKVKSENAAQQPPLIPKKPQNIQLAAQVTARPNSSLGQQQQQQQQQQPTKAHKVVLNGMKTPTNVLSPSAVGHNRKRLHNNATFISVQPIMEHNHVSTKSSPPPPLMPRVPVTSQSVILPGPAIAVNTKLRSNSKASYLPRQSLEKLNNLDPDHGSYKLTLNSNEDLVVSHHTKSSYDIFAQHHNHIHAQLNHHLHNHNGLPQSVLNGKLPPNNLPDVLPLGVKLHTQQAQPASPTSATPTLRYGSNNNLSNNSTSSTANSSPTASTTIYPPMYPPPPTQHRYSSPSMTAYNNNNTVTTQSYSRSQSFDATQPQNALKYMSQSTIDLKKPTSLETTLEETSTTEHLLSPAQSESNLSSPVKIKSPDPAQNNNFKPLSPCSARREFHRSVDGGGNNEARIFRAELVNATLINSHSQSAHKLVARKESLRENIEKITQLQSKLMGAHISGSFDGGNMSSFGNNYHNGNKSISPSMKSSPSLEQIADNKFTDSNTQTEQRSTEKVASISECASPKSPEYVGMVVPPLSAMNQSTDGLKLMQRSEIILRVNPIMTEAACQTDDLADGDMGRLTEHHGKDDPQMSRTTLQPRIRHPIEIDCDNISQELANLLSAQDKLVHILRPHTPKSPSDYVTNLYNPDVPSQPSRRDVGTSTLMRMKTKEKEPKDQDKDVDELMANSIDIKFKPNEVSLQINGHEESDEEDGCNQIKKKVEELIKQINRKVVILNNEQNCINEETALNDELGSNLTNKLSQKVRPLEANKFRTYIDDVGDITSLLLSLAERLARTENTLSNIEDGSEKKSLEQKRDRLFEQLDEAKRLKADIEKRGDLMANMLERYFGARENADFDYFINMKAKLITDARDIAEKIKFSEEQLNALNETLIQSDC